jgi:RNA polymerase sigma-70 factor (ECF subfamily)
LWEALDFGTHPTGSPQPSTVRPSSPRSLEAEPTPPSGERLTLAAIYPAYVSYVRRLVRRRIPRRDVDDFVQQSFLEIHRSLPNHDPARPLKPWITAIVLHITCNHLQRASTRCELLGDEPAEDPHSDSEELVGTTELLREVLAPLNEEQRAIVIRHLRDEEQVSEIADNLKLSRRGGYKLLEAARAKLAAALARHQARERRVLGDQDAFLLPFGLGALPRFDFFAALNRSVRAWSTRARSALGHALATVKTASASLGASAGLALVLGALVAPQRKPSAPEEGVAPTIARTVTAAPETPMPSNTPASATSSAAPLPAFSAKSAAGPFLGASKGNHAPLERRSLDRIQALLETDPAAALAAIELHKKAFPREQLRAERKGIEELAQARAASLRQAHSRRPLRAL